MRAQAQQLAQQHGRGRTKDFAAAALISRPHAVGKAQGSPIRAIGVGKLPGIAEAIANNAGKSQDTAALVAVVRVGLCRAIVQSIVGVESELPVITLEPRLEQILLNSLQRAGQGQEDGVLLEPSMAEKLQRSLIEAAQRQEMQGQPAILLVAGPIRAMLSRFGRLAVPNLHVLAYQEIPDNKQVTIVATVGPNG